MASNRNYSVTLSSLLDTSGIEKAIRDIERRKHTIRFDTNPAGLRDTSNALRDVNTGIQNMDSSMQNSLLTFQAANMILTRITDAIGAMVEQVYELNGAMVEYNKVSDLTTAGMEKQVRKLSELGRQVGRTGRQNTARIYSNIY